MRIFFIPVCICLITYSCGLKSGSEGNYDIYDPNKVYKLHLNPAPGSTYYYDIGKESDIKVKAENKKVDNETQSNTGIRYKVSKDSAGNFVFTMRFDKIHLHTKAGDNETDAETGNGAVAISPTEKILGILKDATITATVSPSGDIKNMGGYKELEDKVMATVNDNDENARNLVKSQWEKVIGDGLVKQNLDQLFKIFPDSAVHLRDTWKLNSIQGSDISLNAKTLYRLKAINSDIAVIGVEGEIESNKNSANAIGFSGATLDLKGTEEGEYEMETKTGMLLTCRLNSKLEGTLSVMGQEIPVTVKTSIKIDGRKE